MNIQKYQTVKILSSIFLIDTKGSGPLFVNRKKHIEDDSEIISDDRYAAKSWQDQSGTIHPMFFHLVSLYFHKEVFVLPDGELITKLDGDKTLNKKASDLIILSLLISRNGSEVKH